MYVWRNNEARQCIVVTCEKGESVGSYLMGIRECGHVHTRM